MARKSGRPTGAKAGKKSKAPGARGKPASYVGKVIDRRRKGAKKRPRGVAAKKQAAKSSSTLEQAARAAKGRRVVVLFADGVAVPQTRGWMDKPGFWKELRRYEVKELVPMFADAGVVDRLERHGRELRADYPWPRFRNYFRLYLRSARRTAALVRELRTWKDVVRLAYEDSEPMPAGSASPAVCLDDSGHVDPAPVGVDAAFAWQFVGGIGEGQSCVDVETGWAATHARLAHLASPQCGTLLCGRYQLGGIGHGTCVLGTLCGANPIISGTSQHVGCAGIAPGVAEMRLASYVSEVEPPPDVLPVPRNDPATEVAENIYAAVSHGIDFLRARGGGVLLLEYQTADLLPLEVLPAMRDLIECAKPDVTVVQAAGNGNLDLDAFAGVLGNFPLRRQSRALDSGAVMVGSAHSAVTGGKHDRFVGNRYSGSNFGTRVDCYAWGENIGTPTAGANNECDLFGGTSGAAAIIAGVALVIRGIAAAGGKHLSAAELRELMSDANNGTPCATGAKIGSMPDLALIAVPGNLGALQVRS